MQKTIDSVLVDVKQTSHLQSPTKSTYPLQKNTESPTELLTEAQRCTVNPKHSVPSGFEKQNNRIAPFPVSFSTQSPPVQESSCARCFCGCCSWYGRNRLVSITNRRSTAHQILPALQHSRSCPVRAFYESSTSFVVVRLWVRLIEWQIAAWYKPWTYGRKSKNITFLRIEPLIVLGEQLTKKWPKIIYSLQYSLQIVPAKFKTALAKAVSLTPSIVVAVSTIFQLFVCF